MNLRIIWASISKHCNITNTWKVRHQVDRPLRDQRKMATRPQDASRSHARRAKRRGGEPGKAKSCVALGGKADTKSAGLFFSWRVWLSNLAERRKIRPPLPRRRRRCRLPDWANVGHDGEMNRGTPETCHHDRVCGCVCVSYGVRYC